jgi:hypothetical protein
VNARGNFSNDGLDTFDERKRWVGIRLQQAVPLLDRDWNELEDIRRHVEWVLRRFYIGDGAPDEDGFRILALPGVADDLLVRAGHYSIGGYDVWLPDDTRLSELRGGARLPALPAGGDAVALVICLQAQITRVTAAEDPDLLNPQDISMETCVRDRLDPVLTVVPADGELPADSVTLASLKRPAAAGPLTDAMLTDARRRNLCLAPTVDTLVSFRGQVLIALRQAQEAIARIEDDLAKVLWVVQMSASRPNGLFGARSTLTVTVATRGGDPVRGATVALTSDWGSLAQATATTGPDGTVSVELLGAVADTHPPAGHIGLLARAAERVALATRTDDAVVDYAKIRFAPEELSAVSKYLPAQSLVDLAPDVPVAGPIIERPVARTVTVTAHALEPGGTIVRGSGTVQVTFGLWVRPWALTNIFQAAQSVGVNARAAGLVLGGVQDAQVDVGTILATAPTIVKDIHDDIHEAIKRSILVDPDPPDGGRLTLGSLGQVVAQETAAAVGQRVDVAISQQFKQLVGSTAVRLDAASGARLAGAVTQATAALHAGFSQQLKQSFNAAVIQG